MDYIIEADYNGNYDPDNYRVLDLMSCDAIGRTDWETLCKFYTELCGCGYIVILCHLDRA